MNQEILIQLQMLQQQAEQIEQKINMVAQQVIEIDALNVSLDKIEENKEKGILANMGKGIYVSAELSSKELLVDIGEKILVKKSVKETKEIIRSQVTKLAELKSQLLMELEQVNMQLQDLILQAQKEHEHSEECGDNCEHKH